MKLISFVHGGELSVGVLENDSIVAVGRHADLSDAAGNLRDRPEFRELVPEIKLQSIDLLPASPIPGKVIGVGLNYRDHVQESRRAEFREPRSEPLLFAVFANAVVAHQQPVLIPSVDTTVDYEGELAVVIGTQARRVSPSNALQHVLGYACANDVSARTSQLGGNWLFGKSCDTFAPLGPWLVTADEVIDPQSLEISTTVNGELRQRALTRDMIFSVAEIISYISRGITLNPWDVILTGTPAGVGVAHEPPEYLKAGDTVRVTISGIGVLENPFEAESSLSTTVESKSE